MKQKKLFPDRERIIEEKNIMEKRRQIALERKKDYEKHIKQYKETHLEPKSEYYTCSCGLIMHWKVAWGRRDGCPKCNKQIKKEEIFKLPDII